MGTVAVCEGSHRLATFKKFQATYGRLDTEAEEGYQGTGWFTEDPAEISRKFGGQWRSEDFQAGDILIFGMRSESILPLLDFAPKCIHVQKCSNLSSCPHVHQEHDRQGQGELRRTLATR